MVSAAYTWSGMVLSYSMTYTPSTLTPSAPLPTADCICSSIRSMILMMSTPAAPQLGEKWSVEHCFMTSMYLESQMVARMPRGCFKVVGLM